MMIWIWIYYLVLSSLGSAISVPVHDFFPFGADFGDASLLPNDDGSSPEVPIRSLFPFFNNQHSSLYVDTNGAISFLGTLAQYTPEPFPLSNDRRIIAPFWADVDIRLGGNVWYRESTDLDLLARATHEIHSVFPSQYRFQASWLFIATWFRVPFYGASGQGIQKRNTFQTVLITNGRHSFTIFYYDEMTWTTGTASGGDNYTGLGGTPAQVGFNAGNKVNYFAVNESRTDEIMNIGHLSNVGVPGKFIFRIDKERIENGGCNTDGTLTITPRYGTMLGAQRIYIGGPCVKEGETVYIVFGGSSERYECQRINDFKVTCVTPMFYSTGNIDVKLIVNHELDKESEYIGIYTILNIAKTSPVIRRHNPRFWMDGQNVEISWKKEKILFTNKFARLDIFYLTDSTGTLKWEHKGMLESNISVESQLDSVTISTNHYISALKMSPAKETSDVWSLEGVWSDVFSIIPNSVSKSNELCSNWYSKDLDLPLVPKQNIQPCPCTLEQALLDTGRFYRDPMCNRFKASRDDNSMNCVNKQYAEHCVRLNSPGEDGFGMQCCYDHTGSLMDANGPRSGGTLHRFHYLGSGNGNVPYLSNFIYDIVPQLQCCAYTPRRERRDTIHDRDNCLKFLERRPASDCRNYEPPRPAMANGDPHMITLDGLQYTFNGVGEYIFLRDIDGNFSAQARLEQFENDEGEKKKASVFTSLVMQTLNNSDRVEVQLNSIRTGDVLINGDYVAFDESSWLDFKGVSVILLEGQNNSSTKDFLIIFGNPKISFKISATKYLLNIIPVVGDNNLKGKLQGMFGNYDGNLNNDLKSRNGSIIPSNSSIRTIHAQFGESWRITAEESMFTYPIGEDYNTYYNPNFEPRFDVPIAKANMSNDICGDDTNCLFDFETTDMEEIAVLTRQTKRSFQKMEDSSVIIVSCGIPPQASGGYWNYSGLTQGNTAELNCYDGYHMSKVVQIECNGDSTWSKGGGICMYIHSGVGDDASEPFDKVVLYWSLGGITIVGILILACIGINCHLKRKQRKQTKKGSV